MKAVAYHADAHYADGRAVGDDYRKLFNGFNKNCHSFGLKTVHVTLEGHEGWGDESHFVSGLDPKNVMLNREIAFCDFLEKAPEDVYWFTEPDYRIYRSWPAIKNDCALLYRGNDGVPITPSWRMATKKALPLFKAFRDATQNTKLRPGVGFDWHCDSEGFNEIYRKMGSPNGAHNIEFLGVSIEFRKFSEYIKPHPIYGRNFAWKAKEELLRAEAG